MTELVFTNGVKLCEHATKRVDELEDSFRDLIKTFDPVFGLFDKVQNGIGDVKSGMKTANKTAKSLRIVIDQIRVPAGPALFLKEVSELALGAAGSLTKSIASSLSLLEAQLAPLNAMVKKVRDLLNKPFLIFAKARNAIIWVQRRCIRLLRQELELLSDPKHKRNGERLSAVWVKIRELVDGILKTVEKLVRSITKKINKLVDRLKKAVEDLKKVLPGFKEIKGILDGINAQVSKLLSAAGPIVDKLKSAMKGAQEAASNALDYLQTLPGVGDAIKATRDAGNKLLETIEKIKKAMHDRVAKAIKDMGLLDKITKPIDAMLAYVSDIAESLKRKVRPVINKFLRHSKKLMQRFSRAANILMTFVKIKLKWEVLIKEWKDRLKLIVEAFKAAQRPERKERAQEISREAKKLGHIIGDVQQSMQSSPAFDTPILRSLNKLSAISIVAAESETDSEWESRVAALTTYQTSLDEHFEIFAPLQHVPEMPSDYFDKLRSDAETEDEEFTEEIFTMLEVVEEGSLAWLPVLGSEIVIDPEEEIGLLPEIEPFEFDVSPLIAELSDRFDKLESQTIQLETMIARAEMQ